MKGTTAPALRSAVLVFTMVVLFIPLICAAIFGFTLPGKKGLTLQSVRQALEVPGFTDSMWISLQLAFLCTIASLLLLIPTLIHLHLRAPRLQSLAESLSVVPMVVPVVALVSGANLFFTAVAPSFLVSVYSLIPFYVVIGLPLVYRTLDAGIRSLNLRTLFDAGASLGAGWWRTVLQIVLPNLGTAVLNASLLSVTLAFGEFALASLLLHNTFPVLVVQVGQALPRAAAALSFLVILLTWLLTQIIATVSHRVNARKVA